MYIKRNLFSFIGLLLGALALLLAITHFLAGPFSPPPSLETLVAGKITAVRESALAALKGVPLPEKQRVRSWDIDTILTISTSFTAIIAIVFGVVATFYKENRLGIQAALLFGAGTLAFQVAMVWLMLVLAVFLIAMVVAALSGNLSF